MEQAFGRFLQGVKANDQIRHKEQQKILPHGPFCVLFNENGCGQKHCRCNDLEKAAVALFLFVVMVMVFMLVLVALAFMFIMMIMFHSGVF